MLRAYIDAVCPAAFFSSTVADGSILLKLALENINSTRSHDPEFLPTLPTRPRNHFCFQSSTGALTIPGAPSTVDDCRCLPVTALSFQNVRFEQAQYCLALAPPRRSILKQSAEDQSHRNMEWKRRSLRIAITSRRQPFWICLFVSPTTLSRSNFQIALCRPPRCLTVVSRIFVIPQELLPAKSHGFRCSPTSALLVCTSTWFSREPPRIRT